ncbi:MAG: NAD(+) diphosphatase, partial [Cryobacterium sp.]
NRPPALVREHIYTLLGRKPHNLNQNDEKGWQFEVNTDLGQGWVTLLNASQIETHDREMLYEEFYGHVEQEHLGDFRLRGGFAYQDSEGAIRQTFVTAVLSARDTGLFTEALGVLNWHHSHGFCPRCGAATHVESAGWVRRCPACGGSVFPRTDPAVIMLITDAQDRLLLGSNALWENNRYSLLAGFVEPGESLEAAVIRESFEESGLRVTEPEYVGSQPWPFPASIMMGFTARLAAEQSPDALLPDGEEILDLRWFSRAELGAAAAGWLTLPGTSSIAHALIARWLEGDTAGELDTAGEVDSGTQRQPRSTTIAGAPV